MVNVREKEAQVKAACLSVFLKEGSGTRDANEWKWEVPVVPGLYLIVWITSYSNAQWRIEEPDTGIEDEGNDLEAMLSNLVSKLRDTWGVDPAPALRLFFGTK